MTYSLCDDKNLRMDRVLSVEDRLLRHQLPSSIVVMMARKRTLMRSRQLSARQQHPGQPRADEEVSVKKLLYKVSTEDLLRSSLTLPCPTCQPVSGVGVAAVRGFQLAWSLLVEAGRGRFRKEIEEAERPGMARGRSAFSLWSSLRRLWRG